MENIWKVAKLGNGQYVGCDNGSFVAVDGLDNAYLGVEGELDESADTLGNGDYAVIDVYENNGHIVVVKTPPAIM